MPTQGSEISPTDVLPSGPVRTPLLGAILFGIGGMMASVIAGLMLNRWTRDRDQQRFEHESRLIASMVEQKMERYEMALNRIHDALAPAGGLVTNSLWGAVVGNLVPVAENFPNLFVLAAAEHVRPVNEAPRKLPVSISSGFKGHAPLAKGIDLVEAAPGRPSMEGALGELLGWVGPGTTARKDGGTTQGIWFALGLRQSEAAGRIRWLRRGETEQTAAARRFRDRMAASDGLLVAFIGTDAFLAEFNRGSNRMVHVQLYAARDPVADSVPLNVEPAPPADPRHRLDILTPWYGRRWTLRFASTPVLEAQSLRYRAWLAWLVGPAVSLAGGLVFATQARGRARERALSARLASALHAQERMSRDLHDGTLQSVYALGLGLVRAKSLVARGDPDAPVQLQGLNDAAQAVITELRSFLQRSDFHTSPTVDIDLAEALADVLAPVRIGTDAEIHLNLESGIQLRPTAGLHVLNIAREALSNAVRHSGARQINVSTVSLPGNSFRLEVRDDGIGFDPSRTVAGKGLQNLADRVRELGGFIEWQTPATGGTCLRVTVPGSSSIDTLS